ncbi:hypothetical protein GCM10029963_05100 [Micromonospora andamanensis]
MTTVTDNGLKVLDGGQLRLLRAVDAVFRRLGDGWGAAEFRFPFLLRTRDLDTFDYYDNFPHLGLAAARLDPERVGPLLAAESRPLAQVPADVMRPAEFALPSAACYAIYLDLAGSVLPAGSPADHPGHLFPQRGPLRRPAAAARLLDARDRLHRPGGGRQAAPRPGQGGGAGADGRARP